MKIFNDLKFYNKFKVAAFCKKIKDLIKEEQNVYKTE